MRNKVVICHKSSPDADSFLRGNLECGIEVFIDEEGFYYAMVGYKNPKVRSEFGKGWASAWIEEDEL